MDKQRKFDVAIIGASIAGASAALRCAEQGLQVLLIDKSDFPRHKACGEGLSHRGRLLLEELPLAARFADITQCPLYGYEICRGDSSHVIQTKAEDMPEVYGVSRYELDRLVLDSAQQHPAIRVQTSCKLEDIREHEEGLEYRTSAGSFRSDYLILADGAKSPCAKYFGPTPRQLFPRTRFGYSRSYRGQYRYPMKRVRVFISDGYQVYCTPTSGASLSVCILADVGRTDVLSSQAQREEAMQQALEGCRFEAEELVFNQGIGPVDCIRRPAYLNERVLLVGDACEQLDPIGGMGMTHALLSSKYAAEALVAVVRKQQQAAVAFKQYAVRREQEVRMLRGFTRLCYTNFVQIRCSRLAQSLEHLAVYLDVGSVVHGRSERRSAAALCASMLLSLFGICP